MAALRELREETGIHVVDLTFAAVAEFDLPRLQRRELLTVYRVQLQVAPRLTVHTHRRPQVDRPKERPQVTLSADGFTGPFPSR